MLGTIIAHYPWFYVFNLLEKKIAIPMSTLGSLFRSAIIGFAASAASDTVSNVVRVVKTVKQASIAADAGGAVSYLGAIKGIYAEGGLAALFGRGLFMRIISNGINSIVFTILWKYLVTLDKRKKEMKKSLEDP